MTATLKDLSTDLVNRCDKLEPRTKLAISVSLALWGINKLASLYKKIVWPSTVLELSLEDTTIVRDNDNSDSVFGSFFPTNTMSVELIVRAIRAAAVDTRVRGLIVHLGVGKYLTLTAVQDIRDAVICFRTESKRQSGAAAANTNEKIAVVYADSFGEAQSGMSMYYLATAFNHIYLAQSGMCFVHDFIVEQPFIKQALAKIGVEARLFSRKEYKSMRNMFCEEKFTDAHREAYQVMFEAWRAQIMAGIAEGRNLEHKTVERLIQEGPYLAARAKQLHLVDDVLYRDQVHTRLHQLMHTYSIERALPLADNAHQGEQASDFAGVPSAKTNLLYLSKYIQKRGDPWNRGKHLVALISCYGNIHTGKSETDWFGNPTSIGSATTAKAIRCAYLDPNVKAILLHVDSGGGSYIASDLIGKEVINARRKGKKVVACMGNVAASGGYFISMHADKIVCQPATITGSIGVVYGKFLTREFWSKVGVNWDDIQFSDNAAISTGLKDYSDENKVKVDQMLDAIYEDFTRQAATGRNLAYDVLESSAKGRIWAGTDAKRLGLVDELGGLDKAMEVICELLQLEPSRKSELNLVHYPPKPLGLLSVLSAIGAENSEEADRKGVGAATSLLPVLLTPILDGVVRYWNSTMGSKLKLSPALAQLFQLPTTNSADQIQPQIFIGPVSAFPMSDVPCVS